MLRNLLNIIKIVLEGKGQYMGQISPNKPFITTMADDLKRTEPPKGQTTPIPSIKPVDNTLKNKLTDIPGIIPKKTILAAPSIKKPTAPSFSTAPKSIIASRPIPPKSTVPSQQKPVIPPQPIIPPRPIAQSFSVLSKSAIKPNIIPQPKEKPTIAETPPINPVRSSRGILNPVFPTQLTEHLSPRQTAEHLASNGINIPKPELPKQKIPPRIPGDILVKPRTVKPNHKKIIVAAAIAIIIISGISGYYYWPNGLQPTPSVIDEEKDTESDPANIPKRKLIKLIDNNNIYYVTEVDTKRLIPGEEILNSYPLNKYEAIITVSQEEFDYYPENIFIKLPDDPKIYKLENGQKRWLKNEDASQNPDFDWTEVAPVNQTEFDFYPEGAPIE